MPDLRPLISQEQVLDLLRTHFVQPVLALTALEGGQVARTFSFESGGESYVVRFNLDRMLDSNFPKEVYLLNRLAATSLPVAPILHLGRLGDLHYAIARKLPGKNLHQHTPQEVQALLPQVLDLLEIMHSLDVSGTQGYGVFDYRGQGYEASWHEKLLKIAREEEENDYFGRWHRLFTETFLERDVFDRIYKQMQDLLAFCPEERQLIFGGLSLNNLLAQDGKITGVLDLLDASYGDPVYDLAPLDFWWPTLGMREAFLADQHQRGREVPHYAERLLCYECSYALDGMRFYAASGNRDAYEMAKLLIQGKLHPR